MYYCPILGNVKQPYQANKLLNAMISSLDKSDPIYFLSPITIKVQFA